MKTEITKSVIQLDKTSLQELVQEVKETIATDVIEHLKASKKVFSAADLWNIQRNKKQSKTRRTNI